MNKILIIDDDKELCELLQRSVLVENINADVCHSGKDGIFLLSTKQYQLIVLDIMMPGLDGFETMERIREKKQYPNSDVNRRKAIVLVRFGDCGLWCRRLSDKAV